MKKKRSHHLNYPPLYDKALEILTMSRHMSYLFCEDLIGPETHGPEDDKIYFTGDIVQQSYNLAPEILRAEEQAYSEDKRRYAKRLKVLTKSLFYTCDRLENSPIKSKEFLPLFRKELRHFRKLQRTWAMML
ncbi:MAG TPA: hypothetical protein DCZ44_00520 [Flavobacteriaceae bacterium]|nr:hypothetical protein [Flavobacteriaceae bacterium]